MRFKSRAIILEHIREGRKKKKKPGEPRPSRATWAARDSRVAWPATRDPGLEVLHATIKSGGFAFFLLLFFYLAFCLAAQKIIKFGSLCFSLRSDGCVLDFFSFFSCVFWLV